MVAVDTFKRDMMPVIINASPRPECLFSRVIAFGKTRRDLSTEAWFARITAVRLEHFVPCAQPAVTVAERAGVIPAVLRAMLAGNSGAMALDIALVWKFTRATPGRVDRGLVPVPATGGVRQG
jgi:hypothetical protein